MHKYYSKGDGSSRQASKSTSTKDGFPRISRQLHNSYIDNDIKAGTSSETDKAINRSLYKFSASRLSPALAAAMLSLPWPPPVSSTFPDNNVEIPDVNEYDTIRSGSRFKVERHSMSNSKSKKIRRKKKSTRTTIIRDSDDDDRSDYLPFHIPKFHEVHTNWPGFEHEPVPNWQEKYLIAKPYPKKLDQESNGGLIAGSSKSNLLLEGVPPLTALKSKHIPKSESKPSSLTKSGRQSFKSKPRQRLQIERIGSCIK